MGQFSAVHTVTILIVAAASVCVAQNCLASQFSCHDGWGCLPSEQFCDGFRHCSDGSDEDYRTNSLNDDANVTLCRREEVLPDFIAGTYTIRYCLLPDNFKAIKDELCLGPTECRVDEFSCTDGSYCLMDRAFCDGEKQCSDGSDEENRNSSFVYDDGVSFCRATRSSTSNIDAITQVRTTRICVVQAHNSMFGDLNCRNKGCIAGEYSCLDGSQCISSSGFCDGQQRDCSDGSDENYASNGTSYNSNATACRVQTQHLGTNDATNVAYICVLEGENYAFRDDLCSGYSCRANEFACKDGSMCLGLNLFCTGPSVCRDGSDDIKDSSKVNFTVRSCSTRSSQGLTTCMLYEGYICDGRGFCEGDTDECLCDENDFLDSDCFKCLTDHSLVVPISKVCDGNMDCPDLTDECLCDSKIRPEVCDKLIWGTPTDSSRRQPYLNCISNATTNETTIHASRICDGRANCLNGEDEVGCHATNLETSQVKYSSVCSGESQEGGALSYAIVGYNPCDGVVECPDYWTEECNCPQNASFCDYLLQLPRFYRTGCIATDGKLYGLYSKDMCDGKQFCANFADERGCKSRFYCTSEPLPNIPKEQRCDRHDGCPNGEDEKNCSHFYCEDGGSLKYLPLHAVCDGIQDCAAGGDECQRGCINSAFSDEEAMIVNKAILVFVWIISVIAIVGCVVVVVVTACDLIRSSRIPNQQRNGSRELSKRMIMSLSASDLLVGVFTFAICIKAAQFNQNYCRLDRGWRSSNTCAGLGAILVIGSQQSVFTMVLIASQRLHAVMRPFAQPKIRRGVVALVVTWIVSILLGVIPLLPINEDYFVTSLTFTPNSIFKTIYKNDTDHLITWLSEMHPNTTVGNSYGNTEWERVKSLIAELNPNITTLYEFGYYASHTVCLPTFFPDRVIDQAWVYSTMLLTINCVAFFYMLLAYIVLYRYAAKQKVLQESSKSLLRKRKEQNIKMQRKLTRILATDFLCWMPICIMGFLQLGGVNIPKDAYLPAGLLVIPINSALNPLLYSDLPDLLLDKLKQIRGSFSTTRPHISTEQENLSRIQRSSV